MEYGSDYITKAAVSAAGLQSTFSVIVRVLNILMFTVNAAVILVMLVKCSKFRRTRAYKDYNGIKTLSKALEMIVIFLVIEAVYGLTRIFSIIDAINLINSIIPDFPRIIYVYLVFITVLLPILGCAISIFAWNYYHKTRRLFFFVYPNGVLPVEFTRPDIMPNDNIFGSGTEANLNFGGNKAGHEVKTEFSDIGGTNYGAQGFYAKASAINSKKTANAANATNAENQVYQNDPNEINKRNAQNPSYQKTANVFEVNKKTVPRDEDFFGTGVSDDYINRMTVSDQEKLERLLVKDTPETEYKVTPAQNNEGGIFGTGSNIWEAVPDMSDPLISQILVTEEEPKAEIYENNQNSVYGTGTTEDYMKRFTTADDDIISELLVQDEPAEQQEKI